jgi:hypothetical protein
MQNLPKQVRGRGFEADFAYGPPQAFYAAGESPQVGRLYVDRFGREREDTFIVDGSERQLVSIDIWDVVAGKWTSLAPTEKKILLEYQLDPLRGRDDLNIREPGIGASYSLPRHVLSEGKDVGTKQIEGLICKGRVIEMAGAGARPALLVECWHSEQIAYIVASQATWSLADGQKVVVAFRLSKIEVRDPDPELFKIPADYKPVKLVPIKK